MTLNHLIVYLNYRPNQLYLIAKDQNNENAGLSSLTDEQSLEILNQHDDSNLHLQQNILQTTNNMTELAVVANAIGIEQVL